VAPTQRPSAVNANASSANTPLSLTPQTAQTAPAAEPRTHLATTTPTAPSSSGGYLVQVSSQRNEADAQASYRVLQGKFPTVLGSRSPLIKRADLGEKGVYYRAMVGPFGSSEEASQFCGSLKTAGGQCVIQRN
jgi:cell division septation protein DedD